MTKKTYLIAPDKFKDSLTGPQVCASLAKGIHSADPQATVISLPLADGGEGTADALQAHFQAREITVEVQDPLGRRIKSSYLLSRDGRVAIVEMARASGLQLLLPEERNAAMTTSIGTGQLIAHALDQGVDEILLCIGGSATNDGGTGMATALGYVFSDAEKKSIEGKGVNLSLIRSVDASAVHPRLKKACISVAVDVTNPFTGPLGATRIYGPQKGAGPQTLDMLEAGMKNLSVVVAQTMNIYLDKIPGTGAAGGLGGGAVAFLGATLRPGIEMVMEKTNFYEQLIKADVVISGEGKIDQQTLSGKVVMGVAETCKKYNKPLILVGGICTLSTAETSLFGAEAVFCVIDKTTSLNEAIRRAGELLVEVGKEIAHKSIEKKIST
ncbi:MAG: glycerate kinase [Cyclobacteriaceae bacterium]|nr:glycerate kinase [Cyclobacteriaceae bacterium]